MSYSSSQQQQQASTQRSVSIIAALQCNRNDGSHTTDAAASVHGDDTAQRHKVGAIPNVSVITSTINQNGSSSSSSSSGNNNNCSNF